MLTAQILPVEPRIPPVVEAVVPPVDTQPAPARTPVRTAPPSSLPPSHDVAHAEPSSSGLPDAPDLTYYGTRQLDVYPELSSGLNLPPARQASAAARALLLVRINAAGAVDDVSVVETDVPDDVDDTRRALLSARFTPAYRNGKAVRSRLLIEINFGSGAPP